jgi:hypothetical protein
LLPEHRLEETDQVSMYLDAAGLECLAKGDLRIEWQPQQDSEVLDENGRDARSRLDGKTGAAWREFDRDTSELSLEQPPEGMPERPTWNPGRVRSRDQGREVSLLVVRVVFLCLRWIRAGGLSWRPPQREEVSSDYNAGRHRPSCRASAGSARTERLERAPTVTKPHYRDAHSSRNRYDR